MVGANLLLRPLVETFKYQREKGHREIEDNSNSLPPNNNQQTQTNNSLSIISRKTNLSKEQSTLSKDSIEPTHQSIFHIVCFPERESRVFELLIEFAKKHELTMVGMESKNVPSQTKPEELEVEIAINFTNKGDRFDLADSQEIVKLLKTEAQANSVKWKFVTI